MLLESGIHFVKLTKHAQNEFLSKYNLKKMNAYFRVPNHQSNVSNEQQPQTQLVSIKSVWWDFGCIYKFWLELEAVQVTNLRENCNFHSLSSSLEIVCAQNSLSCLNLSDMTKQPPNRCHTWKIYKFRC